MNTSRRNLGEEGPQTDKLCCRTVPFQSHFSDEDILPAFYESFYVYKGPTRHGMASEGDYWKFSFYNKYVISFNKQIEIEIVTTVSCSKCSTQYTTPTNKKENIHLVT